MTRLASRLAAFRRAQDGGMLALSAVFMTFACIMLGFVVDTGSLYYTKVKLTKITDSAAAGAVLSAPNATTMVIAGVSLAAKNTPTAYGVVTMTSDVASGFYNASTQVFTVNAQPINAVKVLAARAQDHSNPLISLFGKVLGKASSDVRATSYAIRYGGNCIYILSSSSTAFSTIGHPTLNTSNCPMQVNGSASLSAGTTVIEPYACLGGTIGSSLGWSTPPQQNCNTLPDPLSNVLIEPKPTQCNYNNVPLSGNLSPGVYCFTNAGGIGVSNVTGAGVTLYFDANSYLKISGLGSNLSISAPTTGPYKGVAIFQTRTPNASANSFSIAGNGNISINGLIYLPSSNLSLSGNALSQSYAQLICSTLSMNGSPAYSFNAFGTNQIAPSAMTAHSSLVIPR